MSHWITRRDFPYFYQDISPFPPNAIVQVRSYFWPDVSDTIALARDLWWGYEEEGRSPGEGVIYMVRRLDKPRGDIK